MTRFVKFKTDGLRTLENRLHIVKEAMEANMLGAMGRSMNELNRIAMANLDNSRGTSYSRKTWPHKPESKSIADSKEITTTVSAGMISVDLLYNTPHAHIVEFGGFGKVLDARDYGHTAWPVGASGYGVKGTALKDWHVWVKKIPLQRGYHYLEGAIESSEFTERLMENVRFAFDEAMLEAKRGT